MNTTATTSLLLWLSLCAVSFAQPGERDVSFGTNGIATADIGASSDRCSRLFTTADNKVIAIGTRRLSFINGGYRNVILVARCLADGAPDPGFGTDGTALVAFGSGNNIEGSAVVQPDGKVIVTGAYYFKTNGYDVVVARLNTDGTPDALFGNKGIVRITMSALYDIPTSIQLQPDGKIVIGAYSQIGSVYQFAVARYNSDGSPDNSFGSSGIVKTVVGNGDIPLSIHIQSDGNILAVGTSDDATNGRIALVRYKSNGRLDSTFGNNGKSIVPLDMNIGYCSLTGVLPDGTVLVTGWSLLNSVYEGFIRRIHPDGTLDTTFGTDGRVALEAFGSVIYARSALVTADGKILVTSDYQENASSDGVTILRRYYLNGTPDSSFGTNGLITHNPGPGDDLGSGIQIADDGRILYAAKVGAPPHAKGFTIMRCNTNGVADSTWGSDGEVDLASSNGDDGVSGINILRDGTILATGGSFNGEYSNFSVTRFTPNGLLDASFGHQGSATIGIDGANINANSAAIQSDNSIVFAGEVITGSVYAIALARITKDGIPDSTFGTDGVVTTAFGNDDDGAYKCAVQSDDKIVVTGYTGNSTQYNGFVIRYMPNGSIDSTFGTAGVVVFGLGTEEEGNAIGVQPDGKIVISGRTTSGSDRNILLMRLNPNGSMDNSFGINGITVTALSTGNDGGYSLTFQKDGKILLGGFTYPGSSFDAAIVRYTADGKLDPEFGTSGRVVYDMGSGKQEVLTSIVVQADGKIIAGGYSGTFAGGGVDDAQTLLIRLNPDGSFDNTFGTNGVLTTTYDRDNSGSGSLGLQPNGGIIVATGVDYGKQYDVAVMRLQSGLNLGVDNSGRPDVNAHVYPNALASESTLEYEATTRAAITISLIDMQGKTALILQPETVVEAGGHTLHFNTDGLPHGAYLLRIWNGIDEMNIKVTK